MQDKERPKPTVQSLRKADENNQTASDPRYAALYQAMSEAVKKENRESLTLLVSVQAELRRYDLEQAYSASTILHESFLRGIEAIDKGKPIPYPSAWLRLACRHIIKEKSRRKQRERQLDNTEWLPNEDNSTVETEGAPCENHQKVRQDFQRLKPLDRAVLRLSIVEGLRWSTIQIRLIDMGYKKHSLPALRKRKSRALKLLKAYYYQG